MKTLYRSIIVAALLVIAGATPSGLFAQEHAKMSDGEHMERQMWADMKAGNIAALKARMADGFQSVHQDGARDREGELELIKGLKLGEYTLSGFKVTEADDELIVTYWIAVREMIDGKLADTKPAMRVSVWAKDDGKWQWITHANLNPLGH